ncbi:MAG TPA: TetR/AcrR family transcriptional regulator [Granulicella sp.]
MARLKSEDKRNAILAAAVEVFAERGLSAPTLAISTAAGVAEGTLFTYFRTKEDLINAVYQQIKLDLADAMMGGFPRRQTVSHRLQHVWDQYIAWGVSHPLQQRVLKQIEVHGALTQESREAGMAPFLEIQRTAEEAIEQRIIRDLPLPFIGATFGTLAEMSMEFIRKDETRAELYRTSGFEMLWAAISRKK